MSGREHIAILKPKYCRLILSGEKTIECRLTKTRREPFGMVAAGDVIWLKRVSGVIVGRAVAERVVSFAGLTPEGVDQIREQHDGEIMGEETYWGAKSDSRYGTLIWLVEPRPVGQSEAPDWKNATPRGTGSGWRYLPQRQSSTSLPICSPASSLV